MKKLVFVFAVVASASLFSCGNSKEAAEATDSVAEEAVEEVVVMTDSVVTPDSVAADTVVAVVETPAE